MPATPQLPPRVRLPRTAVRVGAALAGLLLVAGSVTGYRLYVTPRLDTVSSADPADAILALGGDHRTAVDAYLLALGGGARTVVLSDPYGEYSPLRRLCDGRPGPVPVICFRPSPSTTQGEARELGRLAAAHGWHRVIVMAPVFHVSRARMIVQRCFTGDVAMLATPESYSPAFWVYQFAYQSLGYAKAYLVTRGC